MKTKVGVLMGGRSSEHEVSLNSGEAVYKHISRKKYFPVKLLIKKDGTFDFSVNDLRKLDVVFIALHGPGGEDGVMQGFLETLGVKYTGPGVFASAVGMDKVATKTLWRQSQLPVVKFEVVESVGDCKKRNLPYILKPTHDGSSYGISIVKEKQQIKVAFAKAVKYGKVMLEPYVNGTEITVGILGNENPYALPVVEIIPKNEFFDYESKYVAGMAEEIVPARISKKLTGLAQKYAVEAYRVLGCSGFSRVDMFIQNDKVLLSEINTIPGLTNNSLLPKAAKSAGINFGQLIDKIIQYSLNK